MNTNNKLAHSKHHPHKNKLAHSKHHPHNNKLAHSKQHPHNNKLPHSKHHPHNNKLALEASPAQQQVSTLDASPAQQQVRALEASPAPQQVSTPEVSPAVQQIAANQVSPSSNFTHTTQNISSLPKLSLPTFNGNSLHWQTFWDSFDAAVHSNTNLTGVQKFYYLKAQISGDAARAISGFPLTNTNYEQAIILLKERFGQSYKIVNAHMQALLNIPKPSTNLISLRQF
jgi:hypothetical protein